MDNAKRILIIEDDQLLREFYEELLLSEGFYVDAAADGEVGWQKIKDSNYDLILLDIILPKKDGLQILKDMQLLEPKRFGKVVVLSNLGQDAIIKQCFDLGAVGYLIKSALNPDQVLTEVNSYLNPNTK